MLSSIQKKLFSLHSILPFLPERKAIRKSNKLACDFMTRKTVVHIKTLKQALNHGLKLKKVHRVIQFNQKAWMKPHIDMNTKLRREVKSKKWKMNNAVFRKTVENVRKHRDIKLETTDTWLKTSSIRHEQESNWINEIWIRWKDYERICWT